MRARSTRVRSTPPSAASTLRRSKVTRCHDAVQEFADGLLAGCGHTLPSAVVVDIGLLSMPEHGAADRWAVVEANMAWFSNCYAADPDRALDVVLRSAGPRSRLAARDRRFCRDRGHAHPAS
ncbi:hypothetical protein [Streptomyces sp. NPDC060054]|uniref:hypothetical protein n=1 Tax=Streptomyces sp. NPDC060054 TaxID=3347048 RepID=UPI00368EC0BE